MRGGPHTQVYIRIGQVEIREESRRQARVIMLSGVDENWLDRFGDAPLSVRSTAGDAGVVFADGGENGSGLYEIRPGSDGKDDFHGSFLNLKFWQTCFSECRSPSA